MKGPKYDRVVLLVRDLADALIAEFKREGAGKVGKLDKKHFKSKGG